MAGYLKLPLIVVFKKTKRANAILRMKVIKHMDIDKFLNSKTKVPGIPESAVYVQLGIGSKFEKKWKEKYNL